MRVLSSGFVIAPENTTKSTFFCDRFQSRNRESGICESKIFVKRCASLDIELRMLFVFSPTRYNGRVQAMLSFGWVPRRSVNGLREALGQWGTRCGAKRSV